MKKKPEPEYCVECGKKAVWTRCTQFAGDHPYCQEHAEQEPDWNLPDDHPQNDWAEAW